MTQSLGSVSFTEAKFPGATGKPGLESPKSFIDGGTWNVPHVR